MPIAEELASQQQEISVAAFFEQNRQMLGFGSKSRALVTTVKEGVDNAIDAAEEASILPSVDVIIQKTENSNLKVTIRDNGPGIKRSQIPKVFGKLLYGSRFSKRVQRRGQQGIGISAAVLYGQQSTGKHAEVKSKVACEESPKYFEVKIDTEENEPVINESCDADEFEYDHGTEISIYIDATFRSRSALHKYIKRTAIVNPHVSIRLSEPEAEIDISRSVDELPEQPVEIRPHPHGIDIGTLQSMLEEMDSHSISGFLQSEFSKVGSTTAEKIINEFLDREYGRHLRYDVPAPDADVDPSTTAVQTTLESAPVEGDTTLVEQIEAHVNRKSSEATAAFANRVAESLSDSSPVSKIEVSNLVEGGAEDVGDEFDETFGDTVTEKATDGAWTFIRNAKQAEVVFQHVTEATSERKSEEAIQSFSTSLVNQLAAGDERDTLTKNELESLVSTAAKRASGNGYTFGETAQENITTRFWGTMARSRKEPPLIREVEGDRELTKVLESAMKAVSVMAPSSKCLSPITEEHLSAGLEDMYDGAEFYTTSTRDAGAHSGEPYLVEAGIAYGGDLDPDGEIELLRFANRVPLVYKQGGCAITTTVSDIRWNNYKLSDKGNGLPQGPVALVVHIASTNVPFTSESKDAVANVEEIKEETERAVRDVARGLKKYIKKQKSARERQRKQEQIFDILPEFSQKLSSIIDKPAPDTSESIAKIMNGVHVTVKESSGDESVTVRADNYTNNGRAVTLHIQSNDGTISEERLAERLDGDVTDHRVGDDGIEIDLQFGGDGPVEFEMPIGFGNIGDIEASDPTIPTVSGN